MNLGASLIFQHTRIANQYEVAPYLHSFSHHRSSENMLRTVSFPDVVPDRTASLTFTPGDFLELYRAQATHDAVVTLFFIDTVRQYSFLRQRVLGIDRSVFPAGFKYRLVSRDPLRPTQAGRHLDQPRPVALVRQPGHGAPVSLLLLDPFSRPS